MQREWRKLLCFLSFNDNGSFTSSVPLQPCPLFFPNSTWFENLFIAMGSFAFDVLSQFSVVVPRLKLPHSNCPQRSHFIFTHFVALISLILSWCHSSVGHSHISGFLLLRHASAARTEPNILPHCGLPTSNVFVSKDYHLTLNCFAQAWNGSTSPRLQLNHSLQNPLWRHGLYTSGSHFLPRSGFIHY